MSSQSPINDKTFSDASPIMLPQGSTYYSPSGTPSGDMNDCVGELEMRELSLALREAEILKREDALREEEGALKESKDAMKKLTVMLDEQEAELAKLRQDLRSEQEDLAKRRFELSEREDELNNRIKECERELKEREEKLKIREQYLDTREKDLGNREEATDIVETFSITVPDNTENTDPNPCSKIETIPENDDFAMTPQRSYPRQSIGQWSTERLRNNMSVRSLVSSLEHQRSASRGSSHQVKALPTHTSLNHGARNPPTSLNTKQRLTEDCKKSEC